MAGILILENIFKSRSLIETNGNASTSIVKFKIKSNNDIMELMDDREIAGDLMVDNVKNFSTSLEKGIFYVFMVHFGFDLDYDDGYEDLLTAIERFYLHWFDSESRVKVEEVKAALCLA